MFVRHPCMGALEAVSEAGALAPALFSFDDLAVFLGD